MELNLDRVRRNVASATTEDLLDRITVYRAGMEPAAREIIIAELTRRGMTANDVHSHWESKRADVLMRGDVAVPCSFCDRPAVERRWGWHKWWGIVPVMPWRFYYCAEHRKS